MLCHKSFLKRSILIFVIFQILLKSEAAVICKFKWVRCESFVPTEMEFKACRVKAVARDDNYIKVLAHLKEMPRVIVVSIQLYKRVNGWKPFLYNTSVNGCSFLKYPNSNPVVHVMYNVLRRYSNINHTCPYNHDIIVDKLRLIDREIRLPFPIGEYALDTWWKVNGKMWARVNGSCMRSVE